MGIHGKLQSQDGVIHIVAQYIEDITPMMAKISDAAHNIEALANADEVRRPIEDTRQKISPTSNIVQLIKEAPELLKDYEDFSKVKQIKQAMPKGRNFH